MPVCPYCGKVCLSEPGLTQHINRTDECRAKRFGDDFPANLGGAATEFASGAYSSRDTRQGFPEAVEAVSEAQRQCGRVGSGGA